ncbi:MAG: TonB-dependent receptor, partial [Rhizobiaceae bacterium]
FKNLDSKDPRQFLRRLDPDDFYAVYGDDSTSIEDAPTRGKFYVRLERGDSHVMWGNFKTRINGSELLRNERALYGASGVYRSEQTTSFGERKLEASVYAAQAETLPQRDVLRGTGGSAYFLKRQDLVSGSETVTVEVRDSTSGRVLSRRTLSAGTDYDIDPIQGVIILRTPLSSTTADDGVVRDGTLGGNTVNLIVQYEYTPTAGKIDGYSYGGRVQGWVGDKVRLGATAMQEEAGTADQTMIGADVTVRHSDTTYLKAEVAQTEGPGFGRSTTSDGGLDIDDDPTTGERGKKARAYTVRGQLDLADLSKGKAEGTIGAFYERKEDGFSTLDEDISVDQTVWGFDARFKVGDKTEFYGSYEDFGDAKGKTKREGNAEVTYEINEYWKASLGVKHVGLRTPGGLAKENGDRTDIGARLTYSPDDDNSIYVFGQGTVARSGGIERNDRVGVGGETKLTEKIGLTGEVSYGTLGVGALAALTYDPTVDDHYYLGYRLEPDKRSTTNVLEGNDLGGIVIGMKRRYNDVLSAYAENSYDMFGKRRSLTSTYGVTYTPDSLWTTSAGLEVGNIKDPNDSDFDRKAFSLSVGYKDEDRIAARIRGEVRLEDSQDNTRDRETYLAAASLAWKTNDNWRFIANLDAVISNSDAPTTTILDGDYIEASIGYAYRPVSNDRFNLLAKYTFLYDLPGPDQISVDGNKLGAAQRSHILSIDGSYDVTQYLTIGAKYGFRIGEVSPTRAEEDFVPSSAHLGIIRADVHVVHNWDVLLEGRVLHSPSADETDYGALAAVYRHFGDNVKVGVGYNFGNFSDDVSDLTRDDQGVFLNVIGKF